MKYWRCFLFIAIFSLVKVNSCFGQKSNNQQINLGFDSYLNPSLSLKSMNLQLVLFAEERWSIHYSLGFGVTNKQKFYAHYPMGAFWGIYLLANSNGGDNELITSLAVLSFLIPEGVSYNIKINNKLKASPYLNFNSMEYYTNQFGEEKIKPSLGIGSRISYSILPHLGCSFWLGGKILAAEGWGIQSGASIFYQY